MREIGDGHVLLDVEKHRADVILDRPSSRNAMHGPLLSDLLSALEAVESNDDVRAMALLGNGEVFSAGMDLEMMKRRATDPDMSIETDLDDITEFINEMSVPSVASIKGAAIAGSFELVLPVDFRVISADAKYGVIEVTLGLFPHGGATQRLPRLVGLSKAKELVLTGEYIDPEEALACNLVHEVVEGRAKTDERAREWADRLAENAPLGMQHARHLLNAALDTPLEEGLERETELGERLTETEDYVEGFTARLEDREPEFTGQ